MSTLRKVESSDKTFAFIGEFRYILDRKSTVNRPIPTPASIHYSVSYSERHASAPTRYVRRVLKTDLRLGPQSGQTTGKKNWLIIGEADAGQRCAITPQT